MRLAQKIPFLFGFSLSSLIAAAAVLLVSFAVKAATSSANGQFANTSTNYGKFDDTCQRSMTKIYFCDIPCPNVFQSCNCDPSTLPKSVDLGYQQGKYVQTQKSFTVCGSTEASAKAQIPAGATSITATAGASGQFCFSYLAMVSGCSPP